jgi:hypothetical protein
MRSLLLAITLALSFALGACGNGKQASTTPRAPQVSGPISDTAMLSFFQARFPAQVADGSLVLDFGSEGVSNDVQEELRILGITDMKGVAALVPADFETKGFGAIKASGAPSTTVAGLMRDLMIMHDTRGYFTKAWRNTWVTSGPEDFPAPAAYGVDFQIMHELGVFGAEGGMEPEPCGGDWENSNPC